MKEKILNGPQLGLFLGISRQAVFSACQKSALIRRPDKKYDLSNPVNQDYIRKTQSRQVLKQKQVKISPEAVTQAEKNQVNLAEIGSVDSKGRAEAERIKAWEQVRALQIKNDRDRGQLISKRSAELVFSQLHQIDINSFRTLPANVTPKIAACAKVDSNDILLKIEEIIDKEVFKILLHVQITVDKFLLELKSNLEAQRQFDFIVTDSKMEKVGYES